MRWFLNEVFTRPGYTNSLIELRCLPPRWLEGGRRRQVFCHSIDEAEIKARAMNDTPYEVYYGVLPRSHKQGTKEAITEAAVLWVDIDLKVVGGLKDALDQLNPRTSGVPLPTMVVGSGNGVHGYWSLLCPSTDISGVECRNLGLSRAVRGDTVQDCTRILRLPGCVNKKDRHDYKPVEVLTYRPRYYKLSDFDEFVQTISPSTTGRGATILTEPVNLESLLAAVEPKWRDLILYGSESDHAVDYGFDRSRVDFAVAAFLYRAGLSKGQAAAVFTNPDLGVSAKTLERCGNSRRNYLSYTINKAFSLCKQDDDYAAQTC